MNLEEYVSTTSEETKKSGNDFSTADELIIEVEEVPDDDANKLIKDKGMDYALAVAERIIYKARTSI